MVTDKLEGSSEHRTGQEGVLKKTKEVAEITVSQLTSPCSQFFCLLISEKAVSGAVTADVLPFVLNHIFWTNQMEEQGQLRHTGFSEHYFCGIASISQQSGT